MNTVESVNLIKELPEGVSIGEATRLVPSLRGEDFSGLLATVLPRLDTLQPGEWLPVTLPKDYLAQRFRSAIANSGEFVEVTRRKTTVYLRRGTEPLKKKHIPAYVQQASAAARRTKAAGRRG